MSQYNFSTEENGYSMSEVDKYFQRLREEYSNAVEWSKAIEKRAEERSDSALSNENEKLKEESEALKKENISLRENNEKLHSDCRILAAKIRELLANNGDIENSKEAAACIIADAQEQADKTVKGAEEKAASILQIAENECQSIIQDATQRIESLNAELQSLEDKKAAVSSEVDNLTAVKNDICARLDRAKELLDI